MADLQEKELTLPACGKKAVISGRGLTGLDRMGAMMMTREGMSLFAAGMLAHYSQIAALTKVDGEQLVYDSLIRMDTRDIDAIQEALKDDPRFAVEKKAEGPPGPELPSLR